MACPAWTSTSLESWESDIFQKKTCGAYLPIRIILIPAPHHALALMWCCSSFEVEWVGVRGLERGDYSLVPPISFAGPARARAAVHNAARDAAGGGPLEIVLNKKQSLKSWTNLRSHPPPPRARAARLVGADARREARICAPGGAPEKPENPPHRAPPPAITPAPAPGHRRPTDHARPGPLADVSNIAAPQAPP
eukprot:gene10855-biopygen18341